MKLVIVKDKKNTSKGSSRVGQKVELSQSWSKVKLDRLEPKFESGQT